MKTPFNIVYADCPWSYNDKSLNQIGAERHYDTLSLSELKGLKVKEVCAPDCILFMWGTWPLLKECIEVMESWGFKYKTLGFNWVKTNKDASIFMGVGHYTRSNSEFCLIGVRGKNTVLNHGIHSTVLSPRMKHSKKPASIREDIVKLMGDLPRIELFAREVTQGWTCLGNEIDGKDIRVALDEVRLEVEEYRNLK